MLSLVLLVLVACSPPEQRKRHFILDTHLLEETTRLRTTGEFSIQDFRITLFDARTGNQVDEYTNTRRPRKPWAEGCFRASVQATDRAGALKSFSEFDFLPSRYATLQPCPPDPVFRELHHYGETRILTTAYVEDNYLRFAGLSDCNDRVEVILAFELCRLNLLTSSCLPLQYRRPWPAYFRGEVSLQSFAPGRYCVKHLRFLPGPFAEYQDIQPDQLVLDPNSFCFEISGQTR